MEINLIIRELLAKHTYISLPNIGSFVQKYEPAHLSNDGVTFIPPKQSIIFDTSRTFNDEAIENYICDKLGIDQRNATDILNEYLSKVKEDLSAGKDVVFENVGALSKDKSGAIAFKQAQDDIFASSTYGLTDVEITPKNPVKPQQKEVITTPNETQEEESGTPWVMISIVGVFIVVVIASTLIFVPELRFWSNNDSSTEQKIESVSTQTAKPSTPETKIADNTPKTEVPTTKKDSLESKVDQTIKDKTEKKTALYYQEQNKSQDNKTYYLIVGSFGKKENAQKLLDKYKQKGFNPEVFEGNNMYRVSISKTKDKSIAIKEFNKFHSENPSESVWILAL